MVICLEVNHHCNVECAQNSIGSLHKRTSDARIKLLNLFYNDFGDPFNAPMFEDKVGREDGIVWQFETADFSGVGNNYDRWKCRSNSNLPGAVQPCHFCDHNDVCPSDVH
jgi:hypothetical protein